MLFSWEHCIDPYCFANIENSTEEIYPISINEIASEQKDDSKLKAYFKKKKVEVTCKNKYFSLKVFDESNVVVYKDKSIGIPT